MEYKKEVRKKFKEEMEEYQNAESDSHALEELADLLELVYAAAEIHGAAPKELEDMRREKAAKRGSFHERIFLIEVEDD